MTTATKIRALIDRERERLKTNTPQQRDMTIGRINRYLTLLDEALAAEKVAGRRIDGVKEDNP